MKRWFSLLLLSLLPAGPSSAAELSIADASNFTRAMISLAREFEGRSGHTINLIFGSTGKHYAQIRHGAPFDAYFAADEQRPRMLEDEGLTVPHSRFTYAVGKLVLWSPKSGFVDDSANVLQQRNFRYLAMANPKLAPYGRAAQEVLESRGLWQKLKNKIVRGENIGQTYQFVNSGNAELGFVAASQLQQMDQPETGSRWPVPQVLYSPIEQQAVLIRDSEAGRSFMSYIQSQQAQQIIRSYGYGIR